MKLLVDLLDWIIKKNKGIFDLIRVVKRKKRKTIRKPSPPTIKQKEEAKLFLTKRIQELSEECELPFNKLSIRDQKSRWGSCSSKKNISLNRRLYLMPHTISDYIIIHELAHTKQMNHGPEFWKLVDTYYPERKKAMRWLRKNGMNLM